MPQTPAELKLLITLTDFLPPTWYKYRVTNLSYISPLSHSTSCLLSTNCGQHSSWKWWLHTAINWEAFKNIQVTRPHFHIIILESLGWSPGISILKVPPVKANAQWEWEPLAPLTEERDRRPGPRDLELTEDLTSERGLDRKGIFFYDLPLLEFSGMVSLWPEHFLT